MISQVDKRKGEAKVGKGMEDMPMAKPSSSEHRLSTYTKPQLNEAKPSPSEAKIKPVVVQTGLEGLTKAQKKNLKRSQKRAKKGVD
jgi:hypothetical protein